MNTDDRATLLGVSGEYRGRSFDLQSRTRLGRHPHNDIRFYHCTVSNFHAELVCIGDEYELNDLGSKNPVKINGTSLSGPTVLNHNDLLEIGTSRFVFKYSKEPAPDDCTKKNKDRSNVCLGDQTQRLDNVFHTQVIKTPRYHSQDHSSPKKSSPAQTRKINRESRSASENPVVGPRASGFVTGKDGEACDIGEYRRHIRTPSSCKTRCSKPDRALRQASGIVRVREDQEKEEGQPKNTGKLCANIASGLIVVSMIVLFGSKYFHPDGSVSKGTPPLTETDIESAWKFQTRYPMIQEIWGEWESHSFGQVPEEDMDQLLIKAQNQVDDIYRSPHELAWPAFLTCLKTSFKAEQIMADTELLIQCRQLLVRVKIEIEDQELQWSGMLRKAQENNNWVEASQILKGMKMLFDIDESNHDSRLGRAYRIIDAEINQARERSDS